MAVTSNDRKAVHSAEAAALGFYYQTFFALLTLLETKTDDAVVGVEQLDDVELRAEGQLLLFQLKHSISLPPSPVTIKSRALWRTIKVWADILPNLNLSETTLHLIAVAPMSKGSDLAALKTLTGSRVDLARAMSSEAKSVVAAYDAAVGRGTRKLPYEDRIDGCRAFLSLSETAKLSLLRRAVIRQDSPAIDKIEELVSGHLGIVHPDDRAVVARRLVEWWDRQVVYSLCGKRTRVISRTELQQQITCIIGDIDREKLIPDFEAIDHPEDYHPNGMLDRQIRLVGGKPSDLSRAIREEWRAREQRSKWLNEKPSMASVIGKYDVVLREHWSDLHEQMVEACADLDDSERRDAGLKLLRWSHLEASNIVRPIAEGWNVPYYVRGSYQVLAINLSVGWHPHYYKILRDDE